MRQRRRWIYLAAGVLTLGLTACDGRTEAAEKTEEPPEVTEEPSGEMTESEEGEEDLSPEPETAAEEPGEVDTVDYEGRKDRYMGALLGICTENKLPDGTELGLSNEQIYKISDDQFAVWDIDQDGSRELIVQYTSTCTAGMMELVYDYDEKTKELREQFREYPFLTYYDNGVIEAGWSHNQGLAGEFWPYTLWQYDPQTDSYETVAVVDAWDRSLSETDFDGKNFPEDADQDGDGIVYYIMPEVEHDRTDPVDGPEYERWRASYLEGAEPMEIPYQTMTEQNIYQVE